MTISRKQYRPFAEAREYVRSLGLSSGKEWNIFADSDRCPRDIPKHPGIHYKEWQGLRDWLTRTMGYEEAKAWLRENGVNHAKDLIRKSLAGQIPFSIPKNPEIYYGRTGEWKGARDFFVNGQELSSYVKDNLRTGYVSLTEAIKRVREAGIKSMREYQGALKKGLLSGLPCDAARIYAKEWKGWGWFFGTGRTLTNKGDLLPFEEARALARRLGAEYDLRNIKDWRSKCRELKREGRLPKGLTMAPHHIYREWRGYLDWFGREPLPRRTWPSSKMKPMAECVQAVRLLGIKTSREWKEQSRELERNPPRRIPPTLVVGLGGTIRK
jgi:hypothetical protein